jgi:hypothetical protein
MTQQISRQACKDVARHLAAQYPLDSPAMAINRLRKYLWNDGSYTISIAAISEMVLEIKADRIITAEVWE